MNTNLAEVKSTKDYDLFKRINYNREVMIPRIDKIVASIKKYGFILPILVNKDFMVVDGQHRLEAARKAGSDVLYIQFDIPDDLLPILISTVNTTSKNWGMDDFLNMWTALDQEPYLYLSNIVDNHLIRISTLLRLTGTGTGGACADKFKSGTITFTESQKKRTETRLSQLSEIRELSVSYEEFKDTTAFTKAIITFLIHPDYSHDRFIQVLQASPGSIAKSQAASDYVATFSMLYNKGLKRRVRFSGTH